MYIVIYRNSYLEAIYRNKNKPMAAFNSGNNINSPLVKAHDQLRFIKKYTTLQSGE